MPGQDKIIGSTDIATWNSILGKKYIKDKGKIILKRMRPQEILEFDKHNFEVPLNKIKEVKIKEFFDRSITFCTKNGKEYKYSTDEKEEIIKIKNIINRYISTK